MHVAYRKTLRRSGQLYLGDAAFKKSGRKIRLTKEEKETLKGLLSGSVDAVNWTGVLDLAKQHHQHMSDFLMSESFFDVCMEEYHRQNSKKVFLQFLWNFRGIYFPLMYILSQEIPKADIYHAVSAGYAGILGSCASYVEGVSLAFIPTWHLYKGTRGGHHPFELGSRRVQGTMD